MICERERGVREVREVRVTKRCVCVCACVLCESIGARRGDFVIVVFKIGDTYEAYLEIFAHVFPQSVSIFFYFLAFLLADIFLLEYLVYYELYVYLYT